MNNAILLLIAAGLAFAADKPVDFDRDVRPILSDNCFACHGPDDKRRMANLRLDTEEGVTRVANTRLLARVATEKPAARMPPPKSGVTLNDTQITIIRKWVEQGARWERHWAFSPPQRPAARRGADGR